MQKAGRVLIDAHPGPQQGQIVGPGEPEHQLLVRDAGQKEPDVHPPLGSGFQSTQHLLAHRKVGRINIHIPLCLRKDIEIHRLGHRLVVQRAVRVGLHHPVRGGQRPGRRKGGVIRLAGAEGVPAIEEHDRKIPDSGPLQPDGGILPAAKALLGVDVFVREVDAAGVADLSVHHHDLAVVPVVHHHGDEGHHGIERDAADAVPLHPHHKILGQTQQAAEIVVDEPHVHPLRGLPLEDLLHTGPHPARFYDEKLQKDELFRLFQIGQQLGIHRLAAIKILRRRVFPRREVPVL